MKTYLRLFVVLITIFFASLVTALSCDKKDTAGATTNLTLLTNVTNVTNMINNVTNTNISNISNTNITNVSNISNTNVYENFSPPRIATPAGLENFVITPNDAIAKLEGGAIYINAKALADAVTPAISSGNASSRGAADVASAADGGSANVPVIFTISIIGSTGGIMLLQPSTVTKDTLAYTTPATTSGNPPQLETAPITTATYRTYNFVRGIGPHVWNVFSDFSNTDVNGAQGVFYCRAFLNNSGAGNPNGPLTGGQKMTCRFASVNNGVNAAAEVNEAWVDATTTTKDLDVKLFGIDTGSKTIPNLGAPSITSGIDFGNPVNNTVMKQIMNANTYYESELKIRIVKAADY